jgi:HEAT repeat protein
MDQPVTFAKPFAELVRLIAERGDVVAQKAALRSCLAPLKRGTITVATSGDDQVVGGVPIPADSEATGLARRITAHGVATIVFEADAAAAEVLAAAQWLAGGAAPGTLAPEATPSSIASLRTVRIAMRPAEGAPRRASRAVTAEPQTGPGRRKSTRVQAMTDAAVRRQSTAIAAIDPAADAPALLDALVLARTPESQRTALDAIGGAIDTALRSGDHDRLTDLAEGMVALVEGDTTGSRRPVFATLRRLLEPAPLRLIAKVAVSSPARADAIVRVLAHAGDAGAVVVVAHVLQARTLAERHAHFETLIKLPAAIPVLSRMLDDGRWYMARNAADLLGELQARETEGPLGQALAHSDERVRRAAASALAKLGTPGAVQTLGAALRDPSPLVRAQVASGLAGRKGTKSATTLTRALDDEDDTEVQLAILASLGRVATTEAVTRLIRAAESDGRLFKKKPVAVRVAAVHALGEARTPAALAALQSLANDKEREVREAVLRVVVQAQRGESAEMP